MVAVGDCDERVSPTNVLKHLSPKPVWVRLIPPSKNSPVSSEEPTEVFLTVSHGVEIVPVLDTAQIGSLIVCSGSRQSPLLPTGVRSRKPVASHCAPVVAPGHDHLYA